MLGLSKENDRAPAVTFIAHMGGKQSSLVIYFQVERILRTSGKMSGWSKGI